MRERPLLNHCACLAIIAASCRLAHATNFAWQGTSGGNWNTTTNWNPNGTPTINDNVTISATGAYTATITQITAANSITLNNPNATLLLQGNNLVGTAALSLNGNLQLTAGHLLLQSLDGYNASIYTPGIINVQSGASFTTSTNSGTTAAVGSSIFNNYGTVNLPSSLELVSQISNNANWTLGTAAGNAVTLSLPVGNSFSQNSGTLYLNDNTDLSISNGTFYFYGGSILGSSTYSTTTTGQRPSSGGTITLINSSLYAPTSDGGDAAFNAFGTTTLLGDLPSNTNLYFYANNQTGAATLNVGAVNNYGIIAASSNDGYIANIAVASGKVFFNRGTIAANDNTGSSYFSINGPFVNFGLLLSNTSTFFDSNVANEESMLVAPGRALFISNARFNQDAGYLGSNDPTTPFYVTNGTFNYNGGTVALNLRLYNSALKIVPTDTHGLIINAYQAMTLTGDFPANTTLSLTANNLTGDAAIYVQDNATNYGNITFASNDGYNCTLTANGGAGNFNNLGTLNLTTNFQPSANLTIQGTFVNYGTVNANTSLTMNANASNSGDINMAPGVTFWMNGVRFNQDAGYLGNNGSTHFVIHNGGFNYNGGQLNATVDLYNSYLTTAVSDGHAAGFNLYGPCTLYGNFAANTTLVSISNNVVGSSPLQVDANVTNFGHINLAANSGYVSTLYVGDGTATLYNNGSVLLSSDSNSEVIISGEIVNRGQLTVQGAAYFYGNLYNNSNMTILANSTAYITDGKTLFQNGSLNIDGNLNLGNGSSLLPAGTASFAIGATGKYSSGALNWTQGTFSVNGGSATVSGTFTIGGKVVAQGGGNIVAQGGGNIVAQGGGNVISNDGGTIVAAGGGNVISNDGGTIVAAGGGNIVAAGGGNIVAAGGGNIVAGGGGNIVAGGGGNLLPAALPLAPSLRPFASPASTTNTPTFSIIVQTNGTITLQGGSLQADNTLEIDPGATLTGFGTANASLATSAGAIDASGGTLTLNAPLTASGGTLGGAGLLSIPNALTITGNTTLHGPLQTRSLSLNNATLDLSGHSLILQPLTNNKSQALSDLRAALATGSLFTSTLPAHTALALLDNALLNKSSLASAPLDPNSLLLTPELLGDANIDGTVNALDLQTVLNNFGTQTPSWTNGNFDGQPTINLTDLAYVLNNFGINHFNVALDTPTPTPEPTTLTLLTPLLWKCTRRPRRPSRRHPTPFPL